MHQRHRFAAGEFTLLARKIKMCACWMLLILVGCRLSRATQSEESPRTALWKSICVTPGHNVTVPCPESAHEERKFYLFYNEEVIYNHTHGQQPHRRPGVEVHENRANKTFSFTLIGVNASRFGLYSCLGTFSYPPPFTTRSDVRILVLVRGHQCNTGCPRPDVQDQKKCVFPWIWAISLIIASVYGLIISIITIVVWIKLRGADSQSDYINTKPKAPRERRKKRGLQNPIPRYC